MKTKDVIRNRILKTSLLALFIPSIFVCSNPSFYEDYLRKDKVFMLKSERTRMSNDPLNSNLKLDDSNFHGTLQHVDTLTKFYRLIKTNRSFPFIMVNNFNGYYWQDNQSAMREWYFKKSSDVLLNAIDIAYETEMQFMKIDFDIFSSQINRFSRDCLAYDYYGKPSYLYDNIMSQITGKLYDDDYYHGKITIKKPRFIIGIFKDGKIYDYRTYRDSPQYFNTKAGMRRYFNSLTYTRNIYTNDFKKLEVEDDKKGKDYSSKTDHTLTCKDPEGDKNRVGCVLKNDSNPKVVDYRVSTYQYVWDRIKNLDSNDEIGKTGVNNKDFIVYNYFPFDAKNRKFYHEELPNYSSDKYKIYVSDIDYLAYSADRLYNDFSTKLERTDTETSTLINSRYKLLNSYLYDVSDNELMDKMFKKEEQNPEGGEENTPETTAENKVEVDDVLKSHFINYSIISYQTVPSFVHFKYNEEYASNDAKFYDLIDDYVVLYQYENKVFDFIKEGSTVDSLDSRVTKSSIQDLVFNSNPLNDYLRDEYLLGNINANEAIKTAKQNDITALTNFFNRYSK